ncbi:DnaJ domain-containing protein [Aspergillus multicolor]|uniref:J domain-containing protein n=1 Tax=Aspergillus multicolor TaxID=41759 RepID=UPI003CCCDA33
MAEAPNPAPVLPDYYAILGIPETADASAITKGYRKTALAKYPDKNISPTATTEMQRVNQAYHVLLDPVQRRDYDENHYPAIKLKAAQKKERDSILAEFRSMDAARRKHSEQKIYVDPKFIKEQLCTAKAELERLRKELDGIPTSGTMYGGPESLELWCERRVKEYDVEMKELDLRHLEKKWSKALELLMAEYKPHWLGA